MNNDALQDKNYIDNLLNAIDLVFNYMETTEEKKKELAAKIEKSYLTNLFMRVSKEMAAEEVRELEEVANSTDLPRERFVKIQQILTDKVNGDSLINIAVDELEAEVKKLILVTRDTLKGESKDRFINEINSILN